MNLGCEMINLALIIPVPGLSPRLRNIKESPGWPHSPSRVEAGKNQREQEIRTGVKSRINIRVTLYICSLGQNRKIRNVVLAEGHVHGRTHRT
jgi:hypothetical protein